MSVLREHGFGLAVDRGQPGQRGIRFCVAKPSQYRWLPERLEDLLIGPGNRVLCAISGHWWRRDVEHDFAPVESGGVPRARYSGVMVCPMCGMETTDPHGVGEWVEPSESHAVGEGMSYAFAGLDEV
jgi:hypothetical protein